MAARLLVVKRFDTMAAMAAVVALFFIAAPARADSFSVPGSRVSADGSALTDPAARDFLESHEEKAAPARPRGVASAQAGSQAAHDIPDSLPAGRRVVWRRDAPDEPNAHLHVILKLKSKRRHFKDALAGLPWFRPDAGLRPEQSVLSGRIRPQDLKQAVQSPEFSRVSIVPESQALRNRAAEDVVLGLRLKESPFVAEETAREVAKLKSAVGFAWRRSVGARVALGGDSRLILLEGRLPVGARRSLPPEVSVVVGADAQASSGLRVEEIPPPAEDRPVPAGVIEGLGRFAEEMARNAPWVLGLLIGFVAAGVWRLGSFLA
jgi:hypothetical protein